MKPNDITHGIIGAAIDVHRELGPGQDEALYEDAMEVALANRHLKFRRQSALPIVYRGVELECQLRPDFVVEETVVVECKSADLVHSIFGAQVRTYQRLGHWPLGLLLNFNVPVLKEGISRFIVDTTEFRGGGDLSSELQPARDPSNEIQTVIDAGIAVHRQLGTGLLHSVYATCLQHELTLAGLEFHVGCRVQVAFEGATLRHRAQLELVVSGRLLVATRAVLRLLPVDEAQVRSQMRLGNLGMALLLNFHAQRLVDDLKRFGE